MKKITNILLLSIILNCVNAQTNYEDHIIFSKGITLFELVYNDLNFDKEIRNLDTTKFDEKIKRELLNEQKKDILEKSLYHFKDLMDKYPKSTFYLRSMLNTAQISNVLGYKNDAIKYYIKIIEINDDDKENRGDSNPYSLLKNRVCKSLAEIFIKKREFKKAIKYIDLTQKYPNQSFCGNAHAADKIYIATLYTKSYYGLGEIEKAIGYSFPHIFYNRLANNSRIIRLTVKILKANYDNDMLISSFDNAIKNYYKETMTINNEREGYYIDFLNHQVKLTFVLHNGNDDKIEEIQKYIEISQFYKLLKKK